MIPYQDLVAALRSWRERNGLPNFGTEPVASSSAAMPEMAPPVMAPPSAPAWGARTVPPGPPPGAMASVEVDEELEAQVIESEEIYEAEGSDFAMSFQASPAHTPPPPPQPGHATDPGSKFPGGTGYTDPGRTDPEDRFGSSTYDDDFVSEAAPAAGPDGTKLGIGAAPAKDADTADDVLDEDVPAPTGKKTKKKKR